MQELSGHLVFRFFPLFSEMVDNAWWDLVGPGWTLGMPGGTWWDLVGPHGTMGDAWWDTCGTYGDIFRLVMPGKARWDLVGPSQTLGMPGGTWWDPGDALWDTSAFLINC